MGSDNSLNPAQERAVRHGDGPLLVLAGAGTGKTRVITERIAHLIHQGISPEQIVAVTFTNKAAGEMRERVARLLAHDAALQLPTANLQHPFIGTFHRFGVHFLRAEHRAAGTPKRFTIYDRDDSLRAIKRAAKETDVDTERFAPRALLSLISRQKADGLTLAQFKEKMSGDFVEQTVAKVWEHYHDALTSDKALDFDDLLLVPAVLLRNNADIRGRWQKRFTHVLVDEYQDTNMVQHEMIRLLAEPERNVTVVGDVDQNVYSWRGAQPKNMLHFEHDFPGTEMIVLEENYRSTKTILAAANRTISENTARFEKNLFTKEEEGEKIRLYAAGDERDEARFVAETAQEHIADGVSPADIAVLFRTNFQSRVLEEAFLSRGIPYQVLGVRFFERREVKDVLSFVRAALNPSDNTALSRIVNVPPRGIGKVTLLRMLSGREDELSPALAKRVADFRALLSRIRGVAETKQPSETIAFVIRESGLETHLKKGGDDDLERLANARELVSFAKRYDAPAESLADDSMSIEQLLDDAALAADQDSLKRDEASVKLMTVHAAKGLEFETVFVTGLEEGLFPHERSDEERADKEEERRLFYVALTRAKQLLYLSFSSIRTIYGSPQVNVPSQFLDSLDEEHVEAVGDAEPVKTVYLE